MREHRESKQEQDLNLEAMDSRKKPIQSGSDFLVSWFPDFASRVFLRFKPRP